MSDSEKNMNIFEYAISNNFISWYIVPWDTDVFGFTVVTINKLDLIETSTIEELFNYFDEWCSINKVKFISIRIKQNSFNLIHELEKRGFRYIETVLHPRFTKLDTKTIPENKHEVRLADPSEYKRIFDIAQNSFSKERYHVDCNIDNSKANERYAKWADNCCKDDNFQIWALIYDQKIAGFLITQIDNNIANMPLAGIAKEFQSAGLGNDLWFGVMRQLKKRGVKTLNTTISINNTQVMALYSRLGYKFTNPEITLHKWL